MASKTGKTETKILVADRDGFFKEHYDMFVALVDKRKGSWRATSVMEFEDLASELLTRIYQQLHLYDTNRPLNNWANVVISNGILNVLRDKVYKDARPCISGKAPGFSLGSSYGTACSFNLGCDRCGWTKSGLQDSTCKYYKAWLDKKQAKFAVASPLSMENHIDESHSIQSDLGTDYEAAKAVIDAKIVKLLDKEEAKIYRLLYIENLSMKETGKRMGYKKQENSEVPGYLILRTARQHFVQLAKEIIEKHDLCL